MAVEHERHRAGERAVAAQAPATSDRQVPVDAGGLDGAADRPGALWEQGLAQGEQRLSRRPLAAAATGLVGGFDVMIGVGVSSVVAGALGAVLPKQLAATLGGLAFGIGFVLITLGRSELFTENFLIPVGAVMEGRRPLRRLPWLWIPTLAANVAGMFILALIMAQGTVLDHHALAAAGRTADVLAHRTTLAAFLSAILAGLVMTLWTWLGLAIRTDVGRILVALVIGFTIAAPSMNHVIVGTGEMMFGVLGGHSSATWGDIGVNFLLALGGNLIGGTLFVTLSRFIQVRADS
ncbi:MAG TPA: formate/nitrite transporter family protein [Solirubrobacteraceae bacterium]|nr:formate/nitrite transporter family protein [Solirubrobacteraceae bacterium]